MNKSDAGPAGGIPAKTIGWATIVWLVMGAASAVCVLGSWSWRSSWGGLPNTALTTLLFLAAAAGAPPGVPARYRWSMVAGLGFSALGDAFLMCPQAYFLAGLGSFLVAHLCYLWALTSDHRLAQRRLPFACYGAVGVGFLSWVWPDVPQALGLPVILYAATILTMAAQAAGRALSRRNLGAALAAVGAALFVVSDAALAAGRFGHPVRWGHFLVLGTYFGAQAGLASSVVLLRKP